jgi:hypothetical protein
MELTLALEPGSTVRRIRGARRTKENAMSKPVIDRRVEPLPSATLKQRLRPLDATAWSCVLCAHGHYPGRSCGVGGCECRG